MPHTATQLEFPYFLDKDALTTFLTQWCAIEDEEDRLRTLKRELKERHSDDFPMRAILAAVKVIRTRRTLATHAKEPMALEYQGYLETLVERQLRCLDLARDLATAGVTITTGEVEV